MLAFTHWRPWAVTLALASSGAMAQAPAPADLAGAYRHSTVDTVSELYLLEDQTFCLAFMGGSLDLLAGGRWQMAPDGQSLSLQEVRCITSPTTTNSSEMPMAIQAPSSWNMLTPP